MGNSAHSVTTGENFQNARLLVSQETGKKKAPVMMAVKQKFLLNAKIWFSTEIRIIQVNYVLCQYFIIFKVLFS